MADEAARKKIEEGKKKLEALKAKKAAKAAADKGGGDDAPEASPPVPAAQAPAAPPAAAAGKEAPGGGSAAQFAGAHSGHTAGEQDAAAQREISALKDALRAREQQHAKSQEQLAGAHKAQTDAVAVCPGRFGSTRDAEAERMEAEELDRELEKIFRSLEGERMIARPDLDHLARHSEERSSHLLSAAGHALPETYDPDEHHAAPVELCWATRGGWDLYARRWIFIRCCGALGSVSLENGNKVVRSQKKCTRVSAPAKMHPGNLELLRTSRSAVRKHGSSLPMCRWQCCKQVAIKAWDAYWDWGTECLPEYVVSSGCCDWDRDATEQRT